MIVSADGSGAISAAVCASPSWSCLTECDTPVPRAGRRNGGIIRFGLTAARRVVSALALQALAQDLERGLVQPEHAVVAFGFP